MKSPRSWRRHATCLFFALFAAFPVLADSPNAEPDLVLEEIETGKGWKRIIAVDKNVIGDDKALHPPLADLLVVTAEGIENLPIGKMHIDELYEDFGIANAKNQLDPQPDQPVGINDLIIIDYAALEQIETGIWRPEYLALAEQQPNGPGGEAILGCFGWDDSSKSKTWNLNNNALSQNFNLGGGFTGNFNIQLPFVTNGTAKLNYSVKKSFCVPYKFRFKNVQANGQAALGGNAQLSANASLAYKWEHDWQLAKPHLGQIFFWIGFIPIKIDFYLPISAGVKLDAKVSGTLAQSFDLGAAGSFNYTCTADDCTGGSSFQDSFETSGLHASVQAEVEAEANAKVQVRAEVWHGSLINAQAGVKGFAKAKVWAYYGNNCGDADGDGQNETVQAALAEAEAGIDFIYSIGGGLVPDYSGSSNGARWNLGWWDLLGEGGSTVLSPMLAGPSSAQVGDTVSYVVRMRPCYPYTQAVDLQMGPDSWSGTLKIAKPKSAFPAENSTTLSRSFPTGGVRSITATAIRDSKGRELRAASSRPLDVAQPQIYPRGGHWYNPDRSGNGVELLRNMYDEYVAIWYTYEGTEPVWYITDVAPVVGNTWSSPLYRSVWNSTHMTNSITQIGTLGFTFHSDSYATFDWEMGGGGGSEPYHLLMSGSGRSGSWYPPAESGWGLSISEDGSTAVVAVQYYEGGQPTWAMGNSNPGPTLDATMLRHHATGLCPGCSGPINRWSEPIGNVTITPPPQGYHLLVSTSLPGWMRTSLPFYQLAGH